MCKRAVYPIRDNKSEFMVIHFDVCGPSRIPTTSGDMWFVTSVIAILR